MRSLGYRDHSVRIISTGSTEAEPRTGISEEIKPQISKIETTDLSNHGSLAFGSIRRPSREDVLDNMVDVTACFEGVI